MGMYLGRAPKRLKWVRQQHAVAMGRMSLGSTEAVIEMNRHKHQDPAYTVINQHFRCLHKLLLAWGQSPRVELEESFEYWNRRLQAHPEPWRIVVVYWGCTLLCQGTGLEVSHPDQLGSRSNEDRSYQKSVHARLELPFSQGGEPVEVECPTAQ